jgi:hypothetical protein
VALRVKRNTIADLELQHPRMRPHLIQESQSLNDSVVEINEFCLGQLIEVDSHELSHGEPAPRHARLTNLPNAKGKACGIRRVASIPFFCLSLSSQSQRVPP